jgi:superfamily II DNA or RNA helicase
MRKLFAAYPAVSGLKDYQRRVLDELGAYADDVAYFRGMGRVKNPPAQAFTNITGEAWRPLTENPDTPFVCLKVPTGGGKTLIAAHAAGIVYDRLLQHKQERGVVLWTTPSETIRSQTLRALKDEGHPYRKALEKDFSVPVYVMDNREALSVRPDQVRDGLTVIVSTMQALKRTDKEGLKFYEDNGALAPHFSGGEGFAGEDRSFSLFEVVRREGPLIIADEGHNAKTGLALDVIESLDPSFVLELTATPLERSNVLSAVTALELKREQMVKLPVNLHNLLTWEDTLREAVGRRNALEEAARQEREETGEYLRPMLLIQAEVEKESPDKVHVARIKDYLVGELKVPEGQVKIRTGKQDELGDTDLLAEDVEVRYVITRDALREGWDAPFAYVLASVYRLSAPAAVEQLLGRVLRLPNVREKRRPELNEAYVYTSAEEFGKVLGAIVKGMVENGYGRDEVRVKDGSGRTDPYIVGMEARHEGLSIPLMAVQDGGERRELSYARDLLGPDFSLAGLGFAPAPLNDPLAERGRVDVAEDASFKAEVLDPPAGGRNGAVGGTREDLVGWLLEKIGRYKEVADPELLGYVELAVDELLEEHPIDLLHRARYQIRDQIRASLDGHYARWTEERYERLKADGRLVADAGVAYAVPLKEELPASQCGTAYRKSVFEYPGKLNKEEAEFATDLDGLENVRCWYRNPDKGGFSLQGHRRPKFNPDLVAFTESGKVAVLEYKGEDRLSNLDTQYKQALGDDWAALDPENRYFRVVGKADVPETLREISRL